jgi:diaminohydroxyphosphoribosylaminopyrimidine deaminase / 5-amino-6-(5-phosphoribosylamino)uracil reductase
MDFMEQAISLAKLAQGSVAPNPAVGAVLVKDGVVVAKGFTQPPGGQHAEIVAIEQAGADAAGSTLYVTLEPCCHFGRTPPCTRAIVAAGIANVHAAIIDPNPAVAGKGVKELEDSGIKVTLGEHEDQAHQINEAYAKYITTGMPFITVKFAMSLDGKIATRTGDSKWISNAESRQFAHSLRHTSDAIMAGVNTVLADDPHLTTRSGGGRGGTTKKQPVRIIIDGKGRTPQGARIFHETGKTILVLGRPAVAGEKEAFSKLGAEIVEMPSINGIIDLKPVLKMLAEREITSVLVEGGGILVGSLFDQGLVDRVFAFISPVIIGGEASMAVAGRGVDKLSDAHKLKRVTTTRFGEDILISGYVAAR